MLALGFAPQTKAIDGEACTVNAQSFGTRGRYVDPYALPTLPRRTLGLEKGLACGATECGVPRNRVAVPGAHAGAAIPRPFIEVFKLQKLDSVVVFIVVVVVFRWHEVNDLNTTDIVVLLVSTLQRCSMYQTHVIARSLPDFAPSQWSFAVHA